MERCHGGEIWSDLAFERDVIHQGNVRGFWTHLIDFGNRLESETMESSGFNYKEVASVRPISFLKSDRFDCTRLPLSLIL